MTVNNITFDLNSTSLSIVTEDFVQENSHIIKYIGYSVDKYNEYHLYYSNFNTSSFYLVIVPIRPL